MGNPKGGPQPLVFSATPFTAALDKRVLEYVRARGVLRGGERVLVAVSGGPDSTALLLVLGRLRDELRLDITVAHFDHQLRSREEAAGDEVFVRGLVKALDLPLVAGSGDVPARARRAKESVEEAARHLRYSFLAGAARRARATAVALGHTLDDHAETVLLHLLRGSGLDGLSAMRPRAPWPFPAAGRAPAVARPLLRLARRDTERYCRECGVGPRRDPTNDLLIATRNRVRHELLPVLRAFNPRVEEALVRLSEVAARDVEFLELLAANAWRQLATVEDDAVSFAREELASLHPALAARLLRQAVVYLAGSAVNLEAVHVESLLASLARRGYRLSLPGGVTAVLGARRLILRRGEPPRSAGIPETPLPAPGQARAGNWQITVDETQLLTGCPRAGPGEAFLDAEAIAGELVVRSRRPGDRLRPLGLGGEKKVQDILVDAKVPVDERDDVPVVADDRGVVWVVGQCIDERVKVGPETRDLLLLRAARRRPRSPRRR